VDSPPLREQLSWLISLYLSDNTAAWDMQADGTYQQRQPAGGPARQAQAELSETWGRI
jgi:polyphosphate kinase